MKMLQAKDLDDKMVLRCVADVQEARGSSFASSWDVADLLWLIPIKLVRAKLRKLVLRGLLTGCSDSGLHNCRGDYELTDAGRSMLEIASD